MANNFGLIISKVTLTASLRQIEERVSFCTKRIDANYFMSNFTASSVFECRQEGFQKKKPNKTNPTNSNSLSMFVIYKSQRSANEPLRNGDCEIRRFIGETTGCFRIYLYIELNQKKTNSNGSFRSSIV